MNEIIKLFVENGADSSDAEEIISALQSVDISEMTDIVKLCKLRSIAKNNIPQYSSLYNGTMGLLQYLRIETQRLG